MILLLEEIKISLDQKIMGGGYRIGIGLIPVLKLEFESGNEPFSARLYIFNASSLAPHELHLSRWISCREWKVDGRETGQREMGEKRNRKNSFCLDR